MLNTVTDIQESQTKNNAANKKNKGRSFPKGNNYASLRKKKTENHFEMGILDILYTAPKLFSTDIDTPPNFQLLFLS